MSVTQFRAPARGRGNQPVGDPQHQAGDSSDGRDHAKDIETESEEAPSTNNEEVLSPEANTDSRFIPTEQISQDLGVSYPVDI